MSRRNNRNRDGGRSQQYYGHDDRDQVGGHWRGGHPGGRSHRGGRGGPAGRENQDSGPSGGKWQRGKGPRRGGGPSDRGRYQGPHPRSRFTDDDGDVQMGDAEEGTSQRFNPYGRPNSRRKNRPNNRDSRGGGGARGSASSMARLGLPINTGHKDRGATGHNRPSDGKGKRAGQSWAKIIIPYGKKVEKDWLLTSLQNLCSVPFIPFEFHYEGERAIFHVDDVTTGSALKAISNRITTKTGHKVVVISHPCQPLAVLKGDDFEVLKVCLSDRYDPSTKALNLSNLIDDQALKSKGVLGILSRNHIMEAVIKIISENIPEVLSIDISHNKLYNLKTFGKLAEKACQLRSLNLAKNKIRGISELEPIREFSKLEELFLQGNEIVEKPNYTSIVRQNFPKVIRLDRQELPPLIAFDVESPTVLPPVQHSYCGSSQIKKPLLSFLEKYFTVFDSGDRQSFIEVYHDQACFSMMCQNSPISSPHIRKYIPQSRNLLRIKDLTTESSFKLFKSTKVAVVAQLNEMPPTKHDTNSFQVDLSMVQGDLICFTLHGIYKEFSNNRSSSHMVAFSRVFLAQMQPPKLCIINDHLSIREPTRTQLKAAFASPAPTPSTSPVNVPQGSLSPGHGLSALQQEMVAKFIKDSNMNAEWSIKCLAENEWDYERAGVSFTTLQTAGKIPVEAFVK
ncbi:nuclear RNA export factor 1-like isoform X2 [Acanthaster planci]|uniref:Nuclear RNA export factor 1-like isoform X2 n=1 Tax=Acanthaster planci TaxID=133434 RepID=A0A8B7YDU2_ACAPL|nr:nuclear RNA export factor 1-like isoform X2 [Acanthaster planci]